MSNVPKILGIPYDGSSSFMRGPALGPEAIRKALHSGSANYCTELGSDIGHALIENDLGNLSLNQDDPDDLIQNVVSFLDQELDKGTRFLSLGGDHFVSFPILQAYHKHYPKLHLLQIDAHGDLYDHFEGNYHSHACPFARIMENKLAQSLTQIGIRTMTAHQWEQAERFEVKVIEMREYDLSFVQNLEGPLYISLDLDAFDPAFAPGVSHHEPGGFSSRQVIELLHNIKVPVIGADIVELNPKRDPVGITAMLAAKMLKEVYGLML